MNKTALFLAQRMLFTHIYHKSISTMTLICFSGIFIGTFSLALITAIMNGFEVTIHKKIQGINANIIIESYKHGIDMDALTPVLQKEFPEIRSFSPVSTHHVLLSPLQQQDETPIVSLIRGIEPEKEELTTTLATKIIKTGNKHQSFSSLFTNNKIIIGKQLAINEGITVGDTIEILFIDNNKVQKRKVTFDTQQAVVSAIFDTGIDEFDSSVIYCSLDFLEKLFPNMVIEQINVTLAPYTDEKKIIDKLHNRLDLNVYSWKELYPSLVATLKLEKYVSFFIIALILLVASMNIISLLFMQIIQKRPTIAILKAMGMSNDAIKSIFFMMGMMISCIASFFGLVTAIIASLILQHYPFITLPDTYYVTELPVAMTWPILLAVFCVVILFSFCATWLPIQQIRTINISHVLRFEG